MGLGRLVNLDKNRFVGQSALIAEQKRGTPREIVGLEIDWPQVESHLRKSWFTTGSFPDGFASRGARVQGRNASRKSDDDHVVANVKEDDRARDSEARSTHGRARDYSSRSRWRQCGIKVATVVKTPFFNPKRKTATPV